MFYSACNVGELNTIGTTMDEKMFAYGVFIVFWKAFDTEIIPFR